MQQFETVYKQTQYELIEKKSRFIAHIKPIETEDEALDFLAGIKSKHWDATHNVYAYSLLENGIQRYSDDSEPQGTAGIPILQTINGMDLKNIIVVVTRYFGGTLLGTGGLVRAYGKSAKEGILKSQIVTKRICQEVIIPIDYSLLGKAQNKMIELGFIISDTVYEDEVKLKILINNDDFELLEKTFMEIVSGKVAINFLGMATVTMDGNRILEISR